MKRIVRFMEMLWSVVILGVSIYAMWLVYHEGIDGRWLMIFGKEPMSDAMIFDVIATLKIAIPMIIIVWSVQVGIDVWKWLVSKEEEERV